MLERKPGPGMIWQCQACGKTSFDLFEGPHGWDESCALNAVAVPFSAEEQDPIELYK